MRHCLTNWHGLLEHSAKVCVCVCVCEREREEREKKERRERREKREKEKRREKERGKRRRRRRRYKVSGFKSQPLHLDTRQLAAYLQTLPFPFSAPLDVVFNILSMAKSPRETESTATS